MEKHKVISVILSKRRPGRRIVKLDDGSVFRISEDAFILHPVLEGDILSDEDIKTLSTIIRRQKTVDSAYHLLNYRMRSTAELRRRLLQKGFQTTDVNYTLNNLSDKGYLNDVEFAHAFAREKVRNKRIGPIALRMEFRPHGIASEILDEVLNEVYKEFSITELIQYHLRKRKIYDGSNISPNEKKRLIDALRRKGFTWDAIRETLVQHKIY